MSGIISKLRNIQVGRGLSDKEMAKQLRCSRQLYQQTRTDRTPLGKKILEGITSAFPELHQDVIYFLSHDADGLPNNAIRNPLKTALSGLRKGIKKVLCGITRAN